MLANNILIQSIVIKSTESSLESLQELGKKIHDLIQESKYEEAITCCDSMLNTDSNNINALEMKGVALSCLGKHDDAMKCYDQALDIDPNNDFVLINLGMRLHKLGKFDECLAYLEKAIEVNPTRSGEILNPLMLGHYLTYNEQLAICDSILKRDPNDRFAISKKGDMLFKLGRYDEALICYDMILEHYPPCESMLYDKARIKALTGNIEEALSLLQRVVEFEPTLKDIKKSRPLVQKIKEDYFDKWTGMTHHHHLYRELAKTEKDFDAIRANPKFQELIK